MIDKVSFLFGDTYISPGIVSFILNIFLENFPTNDEIFYINIGIYNLVNRIIE